MRDPLAELERHALGVVDEDAQRAPADDLGEQHLDLRLARRRAAARSLLCNVVIEALLLSDD